jgi:hypothetical protein
MVWFSIICSTILSVIKKNKIPVAKKNRFPYFGFFPPSEVILNQIIQKYPTFNDHIFTFEFASPFSNSWTTWTFLPFEIILLFLYPFLQELIKYFCLMNSFYFKRRIDFIGFT